MAQFDTTTHYFSFPQNPFKTHKCLKFSDETISLPQKSLKLPS